MRGKEDSSENGHVDTEHWRMLVASMKEAVAVADGTVQTVTRRGPSHAPSPSKKSIATVMNHPHCAISATTTSGGSTPPRLTALRTITLRSRRPSSPTRRWRGTRRWACASCSTRPMPSWTTPLCTVSCFTGCKRNTLLLTLHTYVVCNYFGTQSTGFVQWFPHVKSALSLIFLIKCYWDTWQSGGEHLSLFVLYYCGTSDGVGVHISKCCCFYDTLITCVVRTVLLWFID